jgi:hypothetical protein
LRIVTDKGSDIATCDNHRDTNLQHAGEECHAILKEVVRDTQDTGSVLDDGDLWRLGHFEGSIHEAIGRYTGIRVDEEDDFATAGQPAPWWLQSCR